MLEALFAVPLCAAIFFSLFGWWRVLKFKSGHPVESGGVKPGEACVLQPLHGADGETYEALATICRQEPPPAEIRYGVDDPADSSVAVVERLKKDFPSIPGRLVVGAEPSMPNGKIANLTRLSQGVTAPVVVAVDQDIAAPPRHLAAILAPLADADTGMVTALYRLGKPAGVGSALEFLSIHADFFPSVLVSEKMEGGLKFAFGATMAVRRDLLDRIGGFAALGDYLADDHELGARVAAAGKRVVLSGSLVEHAPGKLGLAEYARRQVRAARTHRVCRPVGYALSVLTQGYPWLAGLYAAGGASPLFFVMLGAWCAARAASAVSSNAVLSEGKAVWWPLLLLPFHEALRFIFWLLAFTGSRVAWGGKIYRVSRDGKMTEQGKD